MIRRVFAVCGALALAGCGDDAPPPVVGRFGEVTSAVVVIKVAFSDLASASITGNGVSLLRNRFTQGQASVPSSNAVLVDNSGIP